MVHCTVAAPSNHPQQQFFFVLFSLLSFSHTDRVWHVYKNISCERIHTSFHAKSKPKGLERLRIEYKLRVCEGMSYEMLLTFADIPHRCWCFEGNVNSVQEACAKCLVLHILKFAILQTTWKNKTTKHQNAKSIGEKLKTKSLMFFLHFFNVICMISNFTMWAAKHLAQASCNELTLHKVKKNAKWIECQNRTWNLERTPFKQ